MSFCNSSYIIFQRVDNFKDCYYHQVKAKLSEKLSASTIVIADINKYMSVISLRVFLLIEHCSQKLVKMAFIIY